MKGENMASLNRTCIICSTKYRYCPTCSADTKKPTWMILFCGDNCRDLYNILNDYNHKITTKEESYNTVKGIDLSVSGNLPWNFQELLRDILSVENTPKTVEVIDNSGLTVESNMITETVESSTVKEEEGLIEQKNTTNTDSVSTGNNENVVRPKRRTTKKK